MNRRIRIPVWIGNIAGILGSILAGYLIYLASNLTIVPIKFLLYLISIGSLIFFPHGLAHYVTGSLIGVRFRHYSLGRSSIAGLGIPIVSDLASKLPVLTLRIDHASLAIVSGRARVVMFASGAVCSMCLPFIAVLASINELPASLGLVLLVFCCGNLLFDIYYSPRAGDFSRIRSTQ